MTHTNTEAVSDVVTREDAIKFLEGACRNWSKVPRLSEDDIGDVASELLRFALSRRSASNTGGVEVKAEPKYDSADHHETDGTAGVQPFSATKAALASPPSLAAEAEPVAWQWRYPGDKVWSMSPNRPHQFPGDEIEVVPLFPHPSSSVSAEVTERWAKLLAAYDAARENQKDNGPDINLIIIGNYGDLAIQELRAALAALNGKE